MDASTAAPAGGALALSPAPVGGRRHKLKLVTKKKARKVLRKLGLKMRGGDASADPKAAVALPAPVVDAAKVGGADETPELPVAGRRRKTRKGKKSRRSVFGF